MSFGSSTALLGLVALATLAGAAPAEAQTRLTTASLSGGSGVSLGTGQGGETVLQRTPIFLDAFVRTYSDEQPSPVVGGGLRVELDGRVSAALVFRAELPKRLGPVELRAFAGVPFFFAPFTMLGVELGVAVAWPLSPSLSLIGAFVADAFVWGSDLPDDSVVVMLNGSLGIEVRL